jgi:hypothetical protein
VAAELLVMDFEVGHTTAGLTPPAITPQNLLSQLVIFAIVKPDRHVFQ